MKFNFNHIEVIFTFSPKSYFLVHAKDMRYFNGVDSDGKPLMAWTLNQRIDRSEKGKDDDIGIEMIYLSEDEMKKIRKYFTVIEM